MCLKNIQSAGCPGTCPVTFTSGWNCDPEQCLLVRDEAGQPLWLLLGVDFRCAGSDNPSWKLAKDAKVSCFWVKWCDISNDQRDQDLFPLNIPLNHPREFCTVLRFARRGRAHFIEQRLQGSRKEPRFSKLWHAARLFSSSYLMPAIQMLPAGIPLSVSVSWPCKGSFHPVTAFFPQLHSKLTLGPALLPPGAFSTGRAPAVPGRSSPWHPAGGGW